MTLGVSDFCATAVAGGFGTLLSSPSHKPNKINIAKPHSDFIISIIVLTPSVLTLRHCSVTPAAADDADAVS
jgi:hypothetical protein